MRKRGRGDRGRERKGFGCAERGGAGVDEGDGMHVRETEIYMCG